MLKDKYTNFINKVRISISNGYSLYERFSIKYPILISLSIFSYGLILLLSKKYSFGISYIILSFIFYLILKALKDNFELIDNILVFTFVLVLSFTLVTFVISGLAVNFSPIEIRFGDIDAWIGFAGSILGSSITMFALIYTMRHERILREEDSNRQKEAEIKTNNENLEIQKRLVMPIPLLTTILSKGEFITNGTQLNSIIINKSKNGMFLRKIIPLDSEFVSSNIKYEEDQNIHFKPIINLLDDQLIASESQIEFQISILDDKEVAYIISDNKDYCDEYIYVITLSFEVIFSDVLEIQEYSCIFSQKLKLIDQSTKTETIFRYFDTNLSKTTIPKRIQKSINN